jgi:nucleoside-diphosphate-sugar epimerase
VGRDVTKALVKQGHDVYGVVRDEKKLPELLRSLNSDRLKILKGDLLVNADVENLKNQVQSTVDRLDVVVQIVGGGPLTSNDKFTREIFELNYRTTANLIQILESANKLNSLSLFLYLSSLAAMGLPSSSEDKLLYDETTACHPVLPYERAKLETETFLRDLTATHNFKTVILRFPQIYGSQDDALMGMIGLIRKGHFPIVRGKKGSLPLIHVQDAVNAICMVVQNMDRVENKFDVNLISEGSYTYNRLVAVVREKYGKGGALSLPYSFLYVAIFMLEVLFKVLGKPEPLNRRRLLSLTKDRIVDARKFTATFQFKFEQNVERFIADQAT